MSRISYEEMMKNNKLSNYNEEKKMLTRLRECTTLSDVRKSLNSYIDMYKQGDKPEQQAITDFLKNYLK